VVSIINVDGDGRLVAVLITIIKATVIVINNSYVMILLINVSF